jgi:hypothetical protein
MLVGLALVMASLSQPYTARATPGEGYSQAYLGAIAYLRAQADTGLSEEEAQGVLLGEAVAADPLVLGPRSTTELSSLELVSADARGRRAQTLALLGLDVSADEAALMALLELARPSPLSLVGAERTNPNLPKFGEEGTRVPNALDDALALQGLAAAFAGPAVDLALEDAIFYLLEFQIVGGAHHGAWALFDRGTSDGGPAIGDIGVTAQAVLGLQPYRNTTLVTVPNPPLGTVDDALTDATTYLQGATPSGAAEHALRLLALLAVGASTQADLDDLVALASDGNFGSVFATALAARAILAASSEYPFDTDGDTVPNGTDPDSDDDGFCDPGFDPVIGVCSGTDLFPLDGLEWADLDGDGKGDAGDPDVDGDGVLNDAEVGFETTALESGDADGDGQGDNGDTDDDNDGLSDVEELLLGLSTTHKDTDDDTFRDATEVAAGTDGADSSDYPLPDGDIFPLGNPDGVVDSRDALLALRVIRGDVTVDSGSQLAFDRHGDVAPLSSGSPPPNILFDVADALVILRRVSGELPAW